MREKRQQFATTIANYLSVCVRFKCPVADVTGDKPFNSFQLFVECLDNFIHCLYSVGLGTQAQGVRRVPQSRFAACSARAVGERMMSGGS